MRVARAENYAQRIEQTSLALMKKPSTGYYAFVLFLLAIIGWGLYAYITQLKFGLLMTGMRDSVSWGFYIVAFIFWVGASLCGALVSAILRLTHAHWRTPLTRIAELITVASLVNAGLMITVDLGRPDR